MAKPLFASKKLALYCLGSVLIMAHRRNLKSRGFEPPLWGGGESQWGNPVGRIDLLQSAVGEFAKGCIALSIAEGLKQPKIRCAF